MNQGFVCIYKESFSISSNEQHLGQTTLINVIRVKRLLLTYFSVILIKQNFSNTTKFIHIYYH